MNWVSPVPWLVKLDGRNFTPASSQRTASSWRRVGTKMKFFTSLHSAFLLLNLPKLLGLLQQHMRQLDSSNDITSHVLFVQCILWKHQLLWRALPPLWESFEQITQNRTGKWRCDDLVSLRCLVGSGLVRTNVHLLMHWDAIVCVCSHRTFMFVKSMAALSFVTLKFFSGICS